MDLNLKLWTIFTNYKKGYNRYICNIPKASTLQIICNNAKKYDVPFSVLLGIYIIETTNRNIIYRFAEYAITMIYGVLSLLFKMPIKNYTIGVFQIGLGNILSLKLNQNKKYTEYLVIRNFNEYITIIKGFKKSNNIELASILVESLIKESENLSYLRQIRYVGQKYNGRIEYGILLYKLVQALEKGNLCRKFTGVNSNE
jgi:hypothetical protein